MSDFQVFIFDAQDVRVAGTAADPLFCLIDVCRVLGIVNSSQVAGRLDADELTMLNIGSQSGETWFITEPGLYECIFRSDKLEAKKFRKWVTSEVLPAIRKSGSFTDVNHRLQKTIRLCSEKFGVVLKSSPTEARSLVQVFASQSGMELGDRPLLGQQQLAEQSLAMHRVALSFNKHINADKFAEKVSSPEAIAQLRSEMIKTAKENIELHRQLLELQVAATDSVPRKRHDRVRADYETTIDSLVQEIELLKEMNAEATRRAEQYQKMATQKALPASRTKKKPSSKPPADEPAIITIDI